MKVAGFTAAGCAAGIRYKDRLDLGLIVADGPVPAAAVFTKNRVQAAPVLWSREKLAGKKARAILVNSGQANACTGPEGMTAAAASARLVARALGFSADEVLLASTGVIGEDLNVAAMEKAMPGLKSGLGGDNLSQVARAMMTTDTKPKMAQAGGNVSGREFTVVGLAKGAGMICPNMATMLSFILTDAAVDPDYLQAVLSRVADRTFNRITVDGDTSTNDTVFLMASGRVGHELIQGADSPGADVFEKAVARVLADLSKMIVVDGEGATRVVKIAVAGAVDNEQAWLAAMTVANSPLVKTAMFGQDANWGRLMMALGRSGAEFDPEKVDISLNDVPLVRNGRAASEDMTAADEVMKLSDYAINIDLKAGPAADEVLTCDFSLEYVKINADYRS